MERTSYNFIRNNQTQNKTQATSILYNFDPVLSFVICHRSLVKKIISKFAIFDHQFYLQNLDKDEVFTKE